MSPQQPIVADLPVFDPARPELSYNLPKAWRHFKNLVRNKEDTREVFPIFEALPWLGLRAAAEAFLGSARGQAVRASEPFLPALLDDRAVFHHQFDVAGHAVAVEHEEDLDWRVEGLRLVHVGTQVDVVEGHHADPAHMESLPMASVLAAVMQQLGLG